MPAGSFKTCRFFFGYYFILIKNSIDLNRLIAGSYWFAGKLFPVITFYWWSQSFSFFYLGRQTYAGDFMCRKLKNMILICNMLYSRKLHFINK